MRPASMSPVAALGTCTLHEHEKSPSLDGLGLTWKWMVTYFNVFELEELHCLHVGAK